MLEFATLSFCVYLCVFYIVIELVHGVGQAHHSLSDGQGSNILYANCLLLNMLHQSGLIMTHFQHSAFVSVNEME